MDLFNGSLVIVRRPDGEFGHPYLRSITLYRDGRQVAPGLTL